MITRHEEIDKEIARLKMLQSQVIDQRTLEGIAGMIADLEAEKAALADEK
jgi:hypothetical protein